MPIAPAQHEPDNFAYDQKWLSEHQEPTLSNPPNIAADRVEIASLSARIEVLKNAEPGLLRERMLRDDHLAMALRFRVLCLWRLFPVNSLPNDIILHIFRQGTFCSPNNNDAPVMPLIYSSVCKRWRDLALGASWLWGFLAFADDSPYTLTKLFLERSRSAPLLVEVDFSDKKFDYENNTFWPTAEDMVHRLALLLPHMHRWKTLHCTADNWAPLFGVLSMLQNKAAPILKRINITQNFDTRRNEVQPPRIPFMLFGGGMPVLRELNVFAVSIDWHHRSFSNLTDISLDQLPKDALPTVQDFLEMLHESPCLQKLTLSSTGPQWDKETARRLPAVELMCLETLNIMGTRDMGNPLDYAIFVMSLFIPGPALHTLEIGSFPASSDPERALPLLRSHFPQVKNLVLVQIPFDVVTATHWLQAMPNVTHLSVIDSGTEASVLEALSRPAQRISLETAAEVLLPSLATLSVYEAKVEVIRNVVHSRLAIGAPIKKLMFDIDFPETIEALGDLQEIVEFGFGGTMYDSEDGWEGPDSDESDMDSQE